MMTHLVAAMRGRLYDGIYVQCLDVKRERESNCLTTVQKDNLIIEVDREDKVYGKHESDKNQR